MSNLIKKVIVCLYKVVECHMTWYENSNADITMLPNMIKKLIFLIKIL